MFAPQTVYTAGPASYNSSGAPVDIRVTAQSGGVVAGDIVVLPSPSYSTTDGTCYWAPSATTATPGANDFIASTRKIFGVCLDTAAAGASVRVRIRGVAGCTIPDGTSVAAMMRPTATTKALSASSSNAANHLAVAYVLEANASGAAAVRACLFDGLYGLGYHGA